MTNIVHQKIALVTGGGRGIGAAIALKLAGLGAITIVCGRTLARLQHTAGRAQGCHTVRPQLRGQGPEDDICVHIKGFAGLII